MPHMFGWLAADGAAKTGEIAVVLYRHRWLGVMAMGIAILAAVLQYFSRRYDKPALVWLYRLALLMAALLVGATGHFGGMLVYGIDRF